MNVLVQDLSASDVFAGLALALATIRWTPSTHEWIGDDFSKRVSDDTFMSVLTVFCLMYAITGFVVSRAIIGSGLILMVFVSKSMVPMYLALLALVVAAGWHTRYNQINSLGGFSAKHLSKNRSPTRERTLTANHMFN